MAVNGFKPFPHFATKAIHAGQEPEQWNSLAVVPPISMSTTFKQMAPGEHAGFEYSRSGNPTRNCAETCLAALENGKHGMLFSSGLAATSSLTHLLASGDHVVAMNDLYGGTNRFFRQCASRNGITTTFVDATKPEDVRAAMTPQTKMIWVETPTNPLLSVVDIAKVCEIAHEQANVFVAIDNTFATPYFQRPLDLGADCVVHSCTKYINGHSDVVMGAILTNSDSIAERVRFYQNAIGTCPSPFDCFLMNRGMKTLAIRMKEHQINAIAVANFLEADSRVETVTYPGLKSHPQYDLVQKQMNGYGGMISFRIKGGLEEAKTFLSSLKVFTLAESLGGFESLAEHPAIMTHSSIAKEEREEIGIYDSVVRLSVGIEDQEDLLADVDQALAAAAALKK